MPHPAPALIGTARRIGEHCYVLLLTPDNAGSAFIVLNKWVADTRLNFDQATAEKMASDILGAIV